MKHKKYLKNMKNTAAVGADVGRAVRDLAANSTLVAIQGEKQVKNLAKIALHAAEAGTDMQGIVNSVRAFADLDEAVKLAQDIELAFGVSISATDMFRIAQENNIEKMAEAHQQNIELLRSSGRIGDNLNLQQERIIGRLNIAAETVLKTQTGLSAEEERAAKAREEAAQTLNQLVAEQEGILTRIQNILMSPINTFMDEIASNLEEGSSNWLAKLEADMLESFDGKKLQDQMNKGDWSGALQTAFKPLTNILKDILEEVLNWFMKNYEVGIFGISRKTPYENRTSENEHEGMAGGMAKGWAGGPHKGIVGEAGGEVVISRSALRSGYWC